MQQFLSPNSHCIWTFNWINGNIEISVNTKDHIVYSEYAFYGGLELAVILNSNTYLWLETEQKPRLSLDRRVYYYWGKIKWQTPAPQYFQEGILSFKEATQFGQTYRMVYCHFSNTVTGWKFWLVPPPLFDENELPIPKI